MNTLSIRQGHHFSAWKLAAALLVGAAFTALGLELVDRWQESRFDHWQAQEAMREAWLRNDPGE